MAWYHQLDALPPAGLVDQLDCPLYCFWGGSDEVIDELVGLKTLLEAVTGSDLPHEVLPGLDHEGMLRDIDAAVPGVLGWLNELPPPRKRTAGRFAY